VKLHIFWEGSIDTLVGFFGPKEGHLCVSSFKLVIGSGGFGYEFIVHSFKLKNRSLLDDNDLQLDLE